MSSNFTLEWIERYAGGDAEAASWYPCTLQGVAGHASRRSEHAPAPLRTEEVEEWSAWLEAHAAPPAVLENAARLGRSGTLTVVTGQQAGLFGGPMYTLYKAAGAILWARELKEKLGTEVVPVFWVASDDHDFEEVATHAWLDGAGELRRWTGRDEAGLEGAPVAERRLSPEQIDAFIADFRASVPPGEFVDELTSALEELRAPNSLGWEAQFVRLLLRWLGGAGLVPVVPRLEWLRRRAAPIMQREIEHGTATSRALIDAGARLRDLGAESGVLHRNGDEANFFLRLDGVRLKVVWENERLAARHPSTGETVRTFTREELAGLLADSPGVFSPNAALRPLVQDAVLPNVAYIGGPAELIYHAQIGPLYEAFEVFRPAVLPRPRALLLETRIARLLEKVGIGLDECLAGGPDQLRRDAARRADSSGLRERIQADIARAAEAIRQLEATITEATGDTGLRSAAEKLHQGFEKGSSTLAQRTDAFLERRHGDITAQADRIAAGIWPGGSPQERATGALSPLLRTGGPESPMRLLDLLDHHATVLQVIDAARLRESPNATDS
ncbi:MAG: bacillithiol synthase [Candidatus Sumerlaeota bacterium]|nr:bacillithiol synthase [Candidatus Sumerlaeota bacterium]